jgi:hypothetical protein
MSSMAGTENKPCDINVYVEKEFLHQMCPGEHQEED